MTTIRCTRCTVNLPEVAFRLKSGGTRVKICIKCSDKSKAYRARNKSRHQCAECSYACSDPALIKKHIKTVHNRIKDYECTRCNAKFTQINNLNVHVNAVHNKIKECACDQCPFVCSAVSGLQKHIKAIHNKIKDCACNHCPYVCSDASSLRAHIRAVHDKIKDYACDQCDSKFFTIGRRKAHVKAIHDKIKDHVCRQCDAKFSQMGNLKAHTRACTGEEKCSAGEFKIRRVLEEMGIEWVSGSHVIKNPRTGRRLQWDIIVWQFGEPVFIEFDGAQHTRAVAFWGGAKGFENIQYRDKLKNDYCHDEGYLLLRIPHTEYKNIETLVVDFIQSHTDW